METRKLPKKSIIAIVIIILVGLFGFIELKSLKEQKMTEILATMGYSNVKDVVFINKLDVEDKVTRMTSNVYKIKFFDLTSNQTCVGFIHKEKNNTYTKDFDCK